MLDRAGQDQNVFDSRRRDLIKIVFIREICG